LTDFVELCVILKIFDTLLHKGGLVQICHIER